MSYTERADMIKDLLQIFSLLGFLFCLIVPGLARAQEAPTLAIINFTNRNQNLQWQWVSKGLADMLITDLSRTDKFQIVEREKMQKFLDEMVLSTTGLIDSTTAARLGKVAKVKKALFGSYLIKADYITIEAHIIDIDTQEVQHVEWIKGKTEGILDLEKQLALNIIKNFHLKLTETELKSLQYKPTDSIDAATHFYQGLEAHDKGEYPIVLREIRLAIKQDSKYENALIWLGHVYANLGEYEHAVISYKAMVRSVPESTLADDALFWAAKLLYKNLSSHRKALELADKLILNYPDGRLPLGTEIVAKLGHYSQAQEPLDAIYFTYRNTLLKSYIHAFKQDVYLHLGDYRSAYKELVSGFDMPHPAFKVDRLNDLMRRAYNEAGIVLHDDKIKNIVTLDIENPVYEEEYDDPLKRIKDAFVVTEAPKDAFGKEYFIGYRTRGQKKEYYLHSVFLPNQVLHSSSGTRKGGWAQIRDQYVFAAPDGFSISSVDVKLKGFQPKEHGIAVFIGKFGSVGYVNGTLLPVVSGNIMDKKHILVTPGSKRFTAHINVYGGTRHNKGEQFPYIDRWRVKANLIPDNVKGALKIKSNSKRFFAYINPIPLDNAGKQYDWQNSPQKRNVPVLCLIYRGENIK